MANYSSEVMTRKPGALSMKNGGYLEGQLLIATPQIQTSCFAKSVVYVCAHSEDGAMGLIINQPMELNISAKDIFAECGIQIQDIARVPHLQFGGPVETNRGFILHSANFEHEKSAKAGFLKLSSDLEILSDIAEGKGPEKALMVLGYAGWGAKQLEKEIENNSWLTMPTNEEFIFGLPEGHKWKSALSKLHVDPNLLSDVAGHA